LLETIEVNSLILRNTLMDGIKITTNSTKITSASELVSISLDERELKTIFALEGRHIIRSAAYLDLIGSAVPFKFSLIILHMPFASSSVKLPWQRTSMNSC
jgi:hypothetical protein